MPAAQSRDILALGSEDSGKYSWPALHSLA
jgi:hypothetical protein